MSRILPCLCLYNLAYTNARRVAPLKPYLLSLSIRFGACCFDRAAGVQKTWEQFAAGENVIFSPDDQEKASKAVSYSAQVHSSLATCVHSLWSGFFCQGSQPASRFEYVSLYHHHALRYHCNRCLCCLVYARKLFVRLGSNPVITFSMIKTATPFGEVKAWMDTHHPATRAQGAVEFAEPHLCVIRARVHERSVWMRDALGVFVSTIYILFFCATSQRCQCT